MIRKTFAAMLCVAILGSPAWAADKTKTLGTDDQGDAPTGADLLALEVASDKSNLEIRILMSLLPALGSYPGAGIQWSFMSAGRVYVAEAHQTDTGEHGFTLYEYTNGTFKTIRDIDGTFDPDGGVIEMLVPLRDVGARKGTGIIGHPIGEAGDVEIHLHAAGVTEVLDEFSTTKPYRVR